MILVALSTVASGALLWLGTGLSPHPWAVGVAALPVLVASLRRTRPTTAVAAGLAWLLGTTNQWSYLHQQLEMPLALLAAFTLGTALLFAAAVLLFAHLVRTSPIAATFVFPASWAAAEYVVSLVTPHGAWWSLAYTAADVGWLRHLAALTGAWGITFVLLLPAAAVAAATRPGLPPRRRAAIAGLAAAMVVAAAGYGLRPVHFDGPTVRVGLVSVPQPRMPVALTTPAGSSLLHAYLDAAESLARDGARVIVAPEKVFAVDAADLPMVVRPLAELADRYEVTVVIGLALRDSTSDGTRANVALGITGSDVVRYDKHQLIPGIEEDFRPGTRLASVDGYALTVCKDMDFPALMRDIGASGLVLAPAWDFGEDGWSHSRMAVLRGVESGFSVARAARNGSLTASDPGGRVRAEASGPGVLTALADLPSTPVTTVYERLPDTFAWLCLLFLLAVGGSRILGKWLL